MSLDPSYSYLHSCSHSPGGVTIEGLGWVEFSDQVRLLLNRVAVQKQSCLGTLG